MYLFICIIFKLTHLFETFFAAGQDEICNNKKARSSKVWMKCIKIVVSIDGGLNHECVCVRTSFVVAIQFGNIWKYNGNQAIMQWFL